MAHADDDLILDFLQDWADAQREVLRESGYSPSDDNQTASFQFFNMFKRLIEPRPRHVHEAQDIVCPPDLAVAYEAIKQRIASGADLRPHLSRGLTKLDFDDLLVNDWGIYHLHLSTNVDSDGFVTRTGPVLFARFEPNDAYLIVIERHGKNAPNVWTNQNMLKVLHRNWPAVTAPYVFKGASAVGQQVTDDELRRLRKAGVQTPIQVDDAVLMGPGGGYSTAGLSTRVVMDSDRHMDTVQRWENGVVAKKAQILAELERKGVKLERPAKLTLKIDNEGKAYAKTRLVDGQAVAISLNVRLP